MSDDRTVQRNSPERKRKENKNNAELWQIFRYTMIETLFQME